MQGYSPDVSLLPSGGGTITAMSGGGQEGGLQRVDGTTEVLGIKKSTEFEKYKDILMKIAPNTIGNYLNNIYNQHHQHSVYTLTTYFSEKHDKPADDELKEDILNTVLNDEYVPHMQITVESDKDGAITDTTIQDVLKTLAASIDIDLVNIVLDDTGLTIHIGSGAPPQQAATAATTTTTGAPAPVKGGYETLEETAKAAAEAD